MGVNRKWSKIGPRAMWDGWGSTRSGLRLVRGSYGVGGAQPEVVYDWSGGHVRWVGVNRKWSKIVPGVMWDG